MAFDVITYAILKKRIAEGLNNIDETTLGKLVDNKINSKFSLGGGDKLVADVEKQNISIIKNGETIIVCEATGNIGIEKIEQLFEKEE